MSFVPKSNTKVYHVTPGGSTRDEVIIFSWSEYQAYSDEEYKTDPKIFYKQQDYTAYNWYQEENCNTVITNGQTQYDYRACFCIERILATGHTIVYNDPSITLSGIGVFAGEGGQSQQGYGNITFTPYSNVSNIPANVLPWTDNRVVRLDEWVLSTNIPVFETVAEASQYIQYGDNIQNAINNNVPSVEGRAFEITNIWTQGTWSDNGYTPGGVSGHRDVKFRSSEERPIAMYPVEGLADGGIVYGVKQNGSLTDVSYSLDGITWNTADSFPFNYIYRPRVDEIGTFKFALTLYNEMIPIFEDEDTADDYFNGDVDINEALNWPEISNNYPGSDLPIDVGEPDDGTDWGDVYTQNFFANTYLCTTGALSEIANKLYDTTPAIWEDIKKGLEMFGNNPIESVVSLIYYPLPLDSVFLNTSSTNNIWFGGYNFQNMQNSVKQIVYPNGYYYCGGVDFTPIYGEGNWKNYKACRIFVDLPYCGRYELDPAKYWGKHINVIYYIDLTTGGCVACLVDGPATATREGKCLDQFNGIIGTKLSMTLTDFAGYANAQINTLLGAGGQSVNNGISVGESGASAFAAGNAIGMVGAAGSAAALGAIQGAKTVYGLQMNNINKFNQTRGGSTGMLNQYANQKPTFIFIYPDTDNPSNFNKMYGTPSNAGGLVSSFTGYFEADTIKLNISGATESEKEKIRSLLMGGIYIGNRT